MAPKTLKFRARGTALCQDFERLEHAVRRYIGRKFQEVETGSFGFVPTGEAEEVPYRHEYVKACKDGDLYAADEATAAACGVEFDPHFGEKQKDFKAAPLNKRASGGE